MYSVVKTYGHDRGLSCAFRQWAAPSRCKLLHGYSLSFAFTFECEELDECGWVVDFGNMRTIRTWLEDRFDHRMVVAEDDPFLPTLQQLAVVGVADILVLPRVGCEAFARQAFNFAQQWLEDTNQAARVWVRSVSVHEHAGNTAICTNEVSVELGNQQEEG